MSTDPDACPPRASKTPPAPDARVETPAAPSPRAAQRAPAIPTSVMMLDRVGEIVGIVAVTVICLAGKLDGMAAVLVIGAILGVQSGIRTAGSRAAAAAGAGLGAVGLAVLYAPHVVEQLVTLAARARGVAVLALAALAFGTQG